MIKLNQKVMGPAIKKTGIKQFDGENFNQWKYRVEIFFDMEELKDFLTMNAPEDANLVDDWKKNDKKAKSFLVSFVADSHLEYVHDKGTAKEMWSSLVKSFSKVGVASQNYLRKRLLSMKFEDGQPKRI